MEKGDLVLFEQVHNAIVVLLHNGVFACHHLGKIKAQAFDLNAMLGKVVAGMVEMLGRLQQSLGRNTAHIGASATQSRPTLGVFPLVNTSHVKTQLRSPNSRNITTRAAADNDDIKLFRHF